MLEAAREHPKVLREPAPWVNFDDFGDSALLLELRCIVDSAECRVQVASELRHVIDNQFRAAQMEIPFPQRDVHLDTTQPLEIRVRTQE
jgi:potassium efflux system protein